MPFPWRRLLRQMGWKSRVFFRSGASVVERAFVRSSYPQAGEGIALLRLDGIGDFWLSLPLFASFRRAFPDQPLTLVANALWADLAREVGLFQQVVPIAVPAFLRKPAYRYKVLRELRATGPFTALWSVALRRRIAVEDTVARVIPAVHKYAWSRDASAEEWPPLAALMDRFTYTRKYPAPFPFAAHEWLHHTQQVASAGLPPLDFRIYLFLQERWKAHNGASFIAVAGGAGFPERRPAASFLAHLVKAFHQHLQLPIRLFGGAGDRPYLEEVASLLPSYAVSSVEAGSLSLIQVAQTLLRARVAFAPDTGLAHLAATMGVPTVMIAGGGHWGRFIPYPEPAPFPLYVVHEVMPCFGCGWHCRYSLRVGQPFPCLARLRPEEATEKALSWWYATVGSDAPSPHPRA